MQHTNSLQAFVQFNNQPQPDGFVPSTLTELKDIMDGQEKTSGLRSRNVTNMVTTNGINTHAGVHHHPGQGAILNINTASDINIYNNSFIVQTSPSHSITQ